MDPCQHRGRAGHANCWAAGSEGPPLAQNKSQGVAEAISMTQFPFATFSLKPFLFEFLLSSLYPLLLNFGVMLLGCPGVDKKTIVIIMAMALRRYHVRRSGCDGAQAGRRRAKSLDNFRRQAPAVREALFLDDPCGHCRLEELPHLR